MESTFGILALASSIFLAITCLCLMSLDYDALYAADERSILYASAAGHTEVKLASTEVLRGYYISIFLLLFSTLLSTFSHILLTTTPKSIKSCYFHRVIKKFSIYITLISFGCAISLTTLSVTSFLNNESPKWCVPGSAIHGNLITDITPIQVPITYVYNDETDSNLLLTGEEFIWEDDSIHLPSKTYRGEFKRSPLIDGYGRHCFAINDSMTLFWREALWKYAIPISLFICFLMMVASCCDTIEIDELDKKLNHEQGPHHHHKHHHHHHHKLPPSNNSARGGGGHFSNFVQRTEHGSMINDDDEDDSLTNPYYENDVPILKFLKVARLSKKARASIILGGVTEGNRPPLKTAQDLAWDPCFCHMDINEACDPIRLERDFGIKGQDVHHFKVALSTARELRRWIELQSLGEDEKLAKASYRYLTKDNGGGGGDYGNDNRLLNKQKSLNAPLSEGGAGGLSGNVTPSFYIDHTPSFGVNGNNQPHTKDLSSLSISSPSASFTHNRLVIEKKAGIESLSADLSELLLNTNHNLSDEVLYQAFKDAGVVHPGERLRMIALLRANNPKSSSSSSMTSPNFNKSNHEPQYHHQQQRDMDADPMKSPMGNMKISPSQPFNKSSSSSFNNYNNKSLSNLNKMRNTPSPHSPPPTRSAPPPPPSQQKVELQQSPRHPPPSSSPSKSFPQLHVQSFPMTTPEKTSTFIDGDGGGSAALDVHTPSIPLTPYERNRASLASNTAYPIEYIKHNNDNINNNNNNIIDNSNNRPIVAPMDRSTTYYCVKVVAGGKKTCKVSWTPPPPAVTSNKTGEAGDGNEGGGGGARMFCITSKAPNLLKASKTEILVPPPSSTLSSKMSPISLKFVVTPPPSTSSTSSSGTTILEAIAEIYEVRNGGQAAVDLLEFAVYVTQSRG
jgi:hypothetical protein